MAVHVRTGLRSQRKRHRDVIIALHPVTQVVEPRSLHDMLHETPNTKPAKWRHAVAGCASHVCSQLLCSRARHVSLHTPLACTAQRNAHERRACRRRIATHP